MAPERFTTGGEVVMAQIAGGRSGGARRPPSGGPQRGRGVRSESADRARQELQRRSKELATKAGITDQDAWLIVNHKKTLEAVVDEMAFRARVDSLMVRHGLNRALATQVELGQASLDAILSRRRIDDAFARTRHHAVLEEAQQAGTELMLGIHGHKLLRAHILNVDPYEFDYLDLDTKAQGRLHKLEVKFAYKPDDYKKIKRGMSHDDERRNRTVGPLPRPQDRYACSDRRLGEAWDHKTIVTATTLEGDRFTGEIAWVSRYEFALRVKDKEVVVFRHALDHLDEPAKGPKHPT